MRTPAYLMLAAGGTPARLAILRKAAIQHNKNALPRQVKDWRGMREYGMALPTTPVITQDTHGYQTIGVEACIGRHVNTSRQYACDPYGRSEPLTGIVSRISHARYIVGFYIVPEAVFYYDEVFHRLSRANEVCDARAMRLAQIVYNWMSVRERERQIHQCIESYELRLHTRHRDLDCDPTDAMAYREACALSVYIHNLQTELKELP